MHFRTKYQDGDPHRERRYKEFETLEKVETYLKLHQSIFRPAVKDKKCSIFDKETHRVIKVHVFK